LIMPTLSVIIPTYNRKAYVQEAIDSVLAQTYVDYEIIVVDDGSTDGTGEALRARYGDRIRYVWQENQGGSAARNRGVQEGRSRYLLFFDSDDRALPHALATLCSLAAEYPEMGIIGAGHRCIDEQGLVVGAAPAWAQRRILDYRAVLLGCQFLTDSTLVARDWFFRTEGWDPLQEAAQDWDLWLRMAAAGCPMLLVPDVLCEYRLHGAALTADLERQLRGHLRALDKAFAQDDMPDDLIALRGAAYAQVYAVTAERQYGAGKIDEAKLNAARAAASAPDLVSSGELLETMLGAGQSPQVSLDPAAYTQVVLANLPPELSKPRALRKALARRAAAQLFCEYHGEGNRTRMRRLLLDMLAWDFSWIGNRGVWWVGVYACLGEHVAERLRALWSRLLSREGDRD
jgi:GT2 family glycosyltransferase